MDTKLQFSAGDVRFFREHPVPHYYGDWVRQLFLLASGILLLGVPFYATDVQKVLPLVVGAAVTIVCLAAFTSPVARTVMLADAVVSGVGMAIFEFWALSAYQVLPTGYVIVRQVIALIFLFAFYFAGKTLRGAPVLAHGESDQAVPAEDIADNQAYDADTQVSRGEPIEEAPAEVVQLAAGAGEMRDEGYYEEHPLDKED